MMDIHSQSIKKIGKPGIQSVEQCIILGQIDLIVQESVHRIHIFFKLVNVAICGIAVECAFQSISDLELLQITRFLNGVGLEKILKNELKKTLIHLKTRLSTFPSAILTKITFPLIFFWAGTFD
ncbi:hypothetical protein ABG067_003593 [Albugo candida]